MLHKLHFVRGYEKAYKFCLPRNSRFTKNYFDLLANCFDRSASLARNLVQRLAGDDLRRDSGLGRCVVEKASENYSIDLLSLRDRHKNNDPTANGE